MDIDVGMDVVLVTACGINVIALVYLVALIMMYWNSGEHEESVNEFKKGLRYLSFFFLGLVVICGALGLILKIMLFAYIALGAIIGMPVYVIIRRVGRFLLFAVGA